ncbi:MAG: glutaredoxin family protein [Methylococcus sp.]|jgi:hypothetical protein
MAAPIRLLGTEGCHLCKEAEALLRAALKHREPLLTVEIIDIIDDPPLYERFGTKIPVIQISTLDPPLTWPFDSGEIEAYLNLFSSS